MLYQGVKNITIIFNSLVIYTVICNNKSVFFKKLTCICFILYRSTFKILRLFKNTFLVSAQKFVSFSSYMTLHIMTSYVLTMCCYKNEILNRLPLQRFCSSILETTNRITFLCCASSA